MHSLSLLNARSTQAQRIVAERTAKRWDAAGRICVWHWTATWSYVRSASTFSVLVDHGRGPIGCVIDAEGLPEQVDVLQKKTSRRIRCAARSVWDVLRLLQE
jgi:hypothetical protein